MKNTLKFELIRYLRFSEVLLTGKKLLEACFIIASCFYDDDDDSKSRNSTERPMLSSNQKSRSCEKRH